MQHHDEVARPQPRSRLPHSPGKLLPHDIKPLNHAKGQLRAYSKIMMLRGRSRDCILHRPDKLLPHNLNLSHECFF